MSTSISFRRLRALCQKETRQILRDPSSNLIAFVLPVVMLFIFGYGINLDSNVVNIGLVLEDKSPEARRFADSLFGSPYFVVRTVETREEVKREIGRASCRERVYHPV